MKHKHAELIKQWADGAEIEYKVHNGGWVALEHPSWEDRNEYRIKPKQPVVRWKWASKNNYGEWEETACFYRQEEISGTKGYTKLEYTRTEFPE